MATEKAVIGAVEIATAKEMAESGKTPDGKNFVYTDLKTTGLRLIVQGKKASWAVRWRDNTKTIGYVYPANDRHLPSAKSARDLATTVLQILKDDPNKVDNFLTAHWAGQSKEDALKATHNMIDCWTFQECVDAAIEGKTNPEAKKGVFIRELTAKDYRTTFKRECFQKVLQKPVLQVTRGDIEAVRDYVKKHSGTSPANKVVIYTRGVLDYCVQYASGSSQLDKIDPWWKLLATPYELKSKERFPYLAEIAKIMTMVEYFNSAPLPGRAHRVNGVKEAVVAALWWIMLTGQRDGAGLELFEYNLLQDPNDEDWLIAAWAEGQMKGGKVFMLPVPKTVWSTIHSWRKQSTGFKGNLDDKLWVFPSDHKHGGHVTASGVYRILYRLAARDGLVQKPKTPLKGKKVPKRTPRVDLFQEIGVAWYSPHDIRRSIRDFLDGKGIPGGASVMLAHEIQDTAKLPPNASESERILFENNRMARITSIAYGQAQFMDLKKRAIKLWSDALLSEFESHYENNLIEIEAIMNKHSLV